MLTTCDCVTVGVVALARNVEASFRFQKFKVIGRRKSRAEKLPSILADQAAFTMPERLRIQIAWPESGHHAFIHNPSTNNAHIDCHASSWTVEELEQMRRP